MSDTIATYTFLPWVRQGLASKIENPNPPSAEPQERAAVSIALDVYVDGKQASSDPAQKFVSKTVHLTGPGDVIGISPRVIVRTEPRNWITDFEANYLPFVEFYEEDFPWRFTPTAASNSAQQTQLKPWIFLLVLEEGEFTDLPAVSGLLPGIQLGVDWMAILPPPQQAWAWAHVHVSQDIPQDTLKQTFEHVVHENPDRALSRLLSPRRLKPSTAYHAFVIPSFEIGRLAGLGQPTEKIDMLIPSWGANQQAYPIYYRWYFRTGQRGDFEFLARLLEPREVDARVGIRDMDMQDPNFGTTGMRTGSHDLPIMGLEGALKSSKAVPRPESWPPDPADYPPFLRDLEKMVNLQDTSEKQSNPIPQHTLVNLQASDTEHPDPIVSPPLYGRWYTFQSRLNSGQPGWVNELNQDPRLRVPAGFGTKVIQAGQEDYMQKAWQQLGDILRANQKIRQAQVSVAVSTRMYEKHLLNLDSNQQIIFTRQVHSRVIGNSTKTISNELRQSRVEAALKPAFHRIVRRRGVIMRKAFTEILPKPQEFIVKLNDKTITAAKPKQPPAGQNSLNKLGVAALRDGQLTVSALKDIDVKTRSDFKITFPMSKVAPAFPGPNEAESFYAALEALHTQFDFLVSPPPEQHSVEVPKMITLLLAALHPKISIVQRVIQTIQIPDTIPPQPATETIVEVMAHPIFADPMYKPLRDRSSELLIPNLNLIVNNTITLLETNPKFIEAYMVGLNHEMSRELLWSEFPSDQRGSYFRQFWDVSDALKRDPNQDAKDFEESLKDIKPLHEWEFDSVLGTHENRPLPTGQAPATQPSETGLDASQQDPDERKVVLVIRGDLLKRYPTAIIFAQLAQWVPAENSTSNPPPMIRRLDVNQPILEPAFKAQIEPDLYFLGFDLTISQAKGSDDSNQHNPGWFFVIQERPGEPRFGLDLKEDNQALPPADQLYMWNELTWDHLSPDGNAVSVIDLNPNTIPTVIDKPPENDPDDETKQEHLHDLNIKWGSNSADMAYILFQAPVMVAIHAANMLP